MASQQFGDEPATEHPEPIDPDIGDGDNRRRWRVRLVAAVAAGGLIGAPARYELGRLVPVSATGFPWMTLLVNVSGSLVLGALLTLMVERWSPTEYARPFAATGVLGAYTTWSTFMVDTDLLLRAGRVGVAAGYVAATLVVGLGAAYAGMAAVRYRPWSEGGSGETDRAG